MKIGQKLVFAFVAVASLVAIVSYINSTTYNRVLSATEKVYQGTMVEFLSASEMSLALHVSQIAAHDLIADQYRHYSVPVRAPDESRDESSDRQLVERSLTTFEQWLSVSKLATLTEIQRAQDSEKSVGGPEATVSRLDELAQGYAKHARLMDRFLQLTLENGANDANEFLKDQVKTHFDDNVLPLLRDQEEDTEAMLRATLTEIQRAREAGKSVGEAEATVSRLDELAHEYTKHSRLMDYFLQLALENGVDDANEFLKGEVKAHFNDKVLPLVRDHQAETEATLLSQITAAHDSFARARKLNMGVTIVALILATSLGLLMARSIAKPINTLKDAALRIGKGELNTKIPDRSSDEIGVLANAFNQMTTELEKSTVSKTYVDNIIQSMGEMLIVIDADDRIETVNRATLRELEYSQHELLGKPATILFPDDDIPTRESAGTHTALVRNGEYNLLTKGRRLIPVYLSVSELLAVNGSHHGVVYVGKNITNLKRVEDQLRTSLNEKKVLLQEIHHRVKNNLQIVSSLLSLQATRAGDPETKRLFHESEHQIRSMALIHEQLYQSRDLANIDFVKYVRALVRYLKRSYGKHAQRISLQIDVDPVQLSIDEAIPCALLINELAANAIEHAYPHDQCGEIWIAFKTDDGRRQLSVRDNGVGLAETRASHDSSNKTLGLQLVHALVKQLDAESEVSNEHGTKVVITFEAASTGERPTAAV